jgi:hypothetical protein
MIERSSLIKRALLPACAMPLVLVLSGAANAPRTVAIFDFALDDTSLAGQMQGESKADLDRLHALRGELSDILAKSGGYTPVPVSPEIMRQADDSNLLACGGCELKLAKQAGAQLSGVGWVQKVSELILNLNVQIRDVDTGALVAGGSVDIRGDTDESWSRGIAYLAQEHLLSGQK